MPNPCAAQTPVSVLQGQCETSTMPGVRLTTILGSCVAVCLFDSKARIGGMNHFLLPCSPDSDDRSSRYGAFAMELLINALLKKGAQRNDLTAQAFGGARMTARLTDIGGANAAFTIEFLKREGIPLLNSDFGGTAARRVFFTATTGVATCQTIRDHLYENSAPPPAAQSKGIMLF